MLEQELRYNYFFEFAGMPQSGKSTVIETVAHFLKRNGFPVKEFYGGSRYNPLKNASIADLNLSLACSITDFVVRSAKSKSTQNQIFLMDKGLIDRCIFTDTLLKHNLIDDRTAQITKDLLTLPLLLNNINGVFIFATSPEAALEREYRHKPLQEQGEVMNSSFLSTMLSVEIDIQKSMQGLIRDHNLLLLDTVQDDEYLQTTTASIIANIMKTIKSVQITP